MKADKKIDKFWKWFKKNSNKLEDFMSDPDYCLDLIIKQARKIVEGLAFELEPKKDEFIKLTISADGDISLFDIVSRIVDRSPNIENWKFIAFRQRIPKTSAENLVFKKGDNKLSVKTIRFQPIREKDNLDLIVYIDGINMDNYDDIAYNCLTMIDNIIGEYDCVTKIRYFDFQPYTTETSELNDLIPLLELDDYIDKLYKEKKS